MNKNVFKTHTVVIVLARHQGVVVKQQTDSSNQQVAKVSDFQARHDSKGAGKNWVEALLVGKFCEDQIYSLYHQLNLGVNIYFEIF